MSRIQSTFEQLKLQGKKALIPYITAGDPHPKHTVALMHQMVRSGADVIELGVPFSDPMADGPVIQRASERALTHHVTLRDVLGFVAEFRKQDDKTPVVLMGYANPVEAMGYEKFAALAADSGVDGVLTVDYPPEECTEFVDVLKQHQIDTIFLLSPTTEVARVKRVVIMASGFIYYVPLKGGTWRMWHGRLLRFVSIRTCRSASVSVCAMPRRQGLCRKLAMPWSWAAVPFWKSRTPPKVKWLQMLAN
jgi:tryptophan synthase alpha chain